MKLNRVRFAGVLTLATILAFSSPRAGAPGSAAGATYYFSTAGNNSNDGLSPSAPKQSLSLVAGLLEPGVTVLLRRGDVWQERALTWDLSGRQGARDARMTLGAWGSESDPRPVITFAASERGPLFRLADTRYLSVRDLDLRGGVAWRAVRLEGSTRAVEFDRVAVSQLSERRRATGTPFEDGGGGEGGGGGPPTYYFSTSDGDDSYDGLSAQTPRKSLKWLVDYDPNQGGRQPILAPGVTVLLKRGDSWYNNDLDSNGQPVGDLSFQFYDLWDGVSNPAPMVIGAYGTGPRPIVADMYRYMGSDPGWTSVTVGGVTAWRHTQQNPASVYDQVYRLFVNGEPYSKVLSPSALVDKTYYVAWSSTDHVTYMYLKSATFGSTSLVETIEHTDNNSFGGVFVHFRGVANLTIQDIEFRGGNTSPVMAFWAPTSNVTLRNLVLREFRFYGIGFGLDPGDATSATKINTNPHVIDCTIDKTWSTAMNVEPLHYLNGDTPPPPAPPIGPGEDPGLQSIFEIPEDDPPGAPPVYGHANGANGRPPGGDGIIFENTDGALVQGNTVTNMGHTGIGNQISNRSQYGVRNCVIERNDVSSGTSSYGRGFAFAGPGPGATACAQSRGNKIRRNIFRDQRVGSHIGGYQNYVYSNVFDGVSTTTACTPNHGPYALDSFVSQPTSSPGGPPLPNVDPFVMRECVIANNTFSGAPIDNYWGETGATAAWLGPLDGNKILNNLYLEWNADHQNGAPVNTPPSDPCTDTFNPPPTGSYAVFATDTLINYLDLKGNGFAKAGSNQDVLYAASVPAGVDPDGAPSTVPQMQSAFGFTGNLFGAASIIGGVSSWVARFRLNGDSDFLKGGVDVTSYLPAGEAVDYEGAPLLSSFATRGAFQSLDVNGVVGGHTYFSPRTITYTPRAGVSVTLDGAAFASGGTVTTPGEHNLVASYSGLGGEVVWTFTLNIDTP